MSAVQRLLVNHLAQFISEHKKNLIERILSQRTNHITVVLEDIYQSQNASAVIRTCECMGLQDIHIVEQRSKYQINPRVLKGANKWVSFYQYHDKAANNTEVCYEALRDAGYKILVTDPAPDGLSIHDIDIEQHKIAIVFGNELRGVSQYAIDHADHKIKIPMYGFTESLNISVSVAISLHSLVAKLHQAGGNHFIAEAYKDKLRLEWYKKIVRRSDLIEQEFLRTIE